MISRLMVGLLLFMSLTTLGCGKSAEEKAQDIINEHATLKNEINAMGTPSTSWSEAQLNSYIAKLDRLSSLERQAASNDDIFMYGDNSRAIAQNRSLAESALSQKRRAKANKTKIDQLSELANVRDDGIKKMQQKWPETSWSDDELNQAVTDANKWKESSRQARELMPQIDVFSQNQELTNMLIEGEKLFDTYKEAAQTILNERAKNLPITEQPGIVKPAEAADAADAVDVAA